MVAGIPQGVMDAEQTIARVWKVPFAGLVKINWDAALNKSTWCIGFGCVARDWMGNFLGSKCSFQRIMVDPKMVEMMSALHAVEFGVAGGWFDIVFEGDSLQVVNDLNKPLPHLNSTMWKLFKICWGLLIQLFNYQNALPSRGK